MNNSKFDFPICIFSIFFYLHKSATFLQKIRMGKSKLELFMTYKILFRREPGDEWKVSDQLCKNLQSFSCLMYRTIKLNH